MAKSRNSLSKLFNSICPNVYFQPPTGYKIKYPCIIYDLDKANVRYADNAPYAYYDLYSVKYITRDPDDPVRIQILMLPLCSPDKPYIAENLYHHPFRIYW